MNDIQRGFTLREEKGVCYFSIPSFEQAGGVLCAMATRIGGVSPAPYDTLNFSKKRENNPQSFSENMRRFGEAVGFHYQKAIANNYAHGPELHKGELRDAGAGVTRENLSCKCDGLYTDVAELPLITYHADCVPLFFYDPHRHAAAICHAGWRGVSTHITKNAVRSLIEMGCDAENILCAVGPCISVKHFEVGHDVFDVFINIFGKDVTEKRNGRMYVDLPKACVKDMIDTGIIARNITVSDLCTYEDRRLFFSHRRDNGATGAMAAVIELKD